MMCTLIIMFLIGFPCLLYLYLFHFKTKIAFAKNQYSFMNSLPVSAVADDERIMLKSIYIYRECLMDLEKGVENMLKDSHPVLKPGLESALRHVKLTRYIYKI